MHRTIFLIVLASTQLFTACQTDSNVIGFGGPTATPDQTPTPLPTPVQVFQTTISADGEVILPLPPQQITFPAGGSTSVIEEVYVRSGQTVRQGDPLAKIEDTDLRIALDKAEAALAVTKAQIASEEAPALAGDIAEAQANLEAAQAEVDRLRDLPSPEAITQAAADLRLREVELRQAQEAYDAVAFAEAIGMSPQAAELQTATLNYERAQAAYDEATKPASEAELASARSRVVQAQNALEKLVEGVRPEVKAVNQARLAEAQIQVDEARANLAKTILYAPWDGVVTEVNGAPGVPVSNVSITLVQVEPLRFATSNFSERNLADIKVGDEATIYLKTYSSTPFPGVIQRVELESSAKDGDTALFTVYIDFNSGDFPVQPGMTGRVEINIEPSF
ncbi:MAG TPA: biotin/lipoyl-binding protein [Anaerolineae bacterium]|nr:biotin/lipoyl-binding protein [Anaerolineae bacterium]HMR67422.1 biotin/lipoyl-binding protein [Anaerolineae bacterium]